MTDYIKREDALYFMNAQREQIKKQMDEALAYEHFHTRSDLKCELLQLEGDICLLESMSAADVRPVVFCKDCKHSDTFPADGEVPEMPLKCLGIRYGGVMGDWYCEHGERRANDG